MEGNRKISDAVESGTRHVSDVPDLPITIEITGEIFGVVVVSEIREDRRQTLLTIAVGETENLVVLIAGGADFFLGKLVRIDGAQSLIFGADDERIGLPIIGAASIPPLLKSSGKCLPEMISKRRAKKAVQSEAQRLVDVRNKLAERYERDGLKGNWSTVDLILLLGRLGGAEKDQIAQIAALKIFHHAMQTGDCSAAGKLAAELSSDRCDRLKTWLEEYSPINLKLQSQPMRARINRQSEKNFAPRGAEANPFYKMPR